MLHYEILPDEHVVVLRPEGALTAGDFQQLTRDVDAYLAKYARIRGVMVEATEFPGWDSFAALSGHMRFIRNHHRLIQRVAVVSDAPFAKLGPAIARHFISAQVRRFDPSEREAAMAWLMSPEEQKTPA